MARILGGGVFGQMSGKLGGLVFARNRGGNYARSFVKPIDPKTIAQIIARSNFGLSANNYHSLDPSLKTGWNEFASMAFNPKSGTQGIPSGFNAYVSLLNTVKNTKLNGTWEVSINSTPVLMPVKNNFVFSPVAPVNNIEANFKAVTSGSVPFTLQQISVTDFSTNEMVATFGLDIVLNVSGSTVPSGGLSSFTDANNNEFGFVVYMSNAVEQPTMFIQNPYLIQLCTVQGLSSFTAVTAPTEIRLSSQDININLADYRNFVSLGQYVRLTVFQVSNGGMLNKLGSDTLEIGSF